MTVSIIFLGIWMSLIMYHIWSIRKRVDKLEGEIKDYRTPQTILRRIDKLKEEKDGNKDN